MHEQVESRSKDRKIKKDLPEHRSGTCTEISFKWNKQPPPDISDDKKVYQAFQTTVQIHSYVWQAFNHIYVKP